jgi:phage gp45-like
MSAIEQARKFADKALSNAQRMVQRGIVGAVSASLRGQIQIDEANNQDNVEYWQQHGFSSRPPAGGEVLFVLVIGNERHPIAIAGRDRRFLPTDLESGDTAIYAQVEQDRAEVRAKADGDVDLSAPGSGNTVNVGGDSEFLLLGESFKQRMDKLWIDLTTGPPPLTAAILAGYLTTFSQNALLLLADKGKVT